jgi:hypothetical protein
MSWCLCVRVWVRGARLGDLGSISRPPVILQGRAESQMTSQSITATLLPVYPMPESGKWKKNFVLNSRRAATCSGFAYVSLSLYVRISQCRRKQRATRCVASVYMSVSLYVLVFLWPSLSVGVNSRRNTTCKCQSICPGLFVSMSMCQGVCGLKFSKRQNCHLVKFVIFQCFSVSAWTVAAPPHVVFCLCPCVNVKIWWKWIPP